MGIDNPVHLIFIAAVALIVLGPKRLPDLARSLGNGMREFRESLSEASHGDAQVHAPAPPRAQQAQLVAAPASVAVESPVVDPGAPDPASSDRSSPDLASRGPAAPDRAAPGPVAHDLAAPRPAAPGSDPVAPGQAGSITSEAIAIEQPASPSVS